MTYNFCSQIDANESRGWWRVRLVALASLTLRVEKAVVQQEFRTRVLCGCEVERAAVVEGVARESQRLPRGESRTGCC